jgi:hypothetical protein
LLSSSTKFDNSTNVEVLLYILTFAIKNQFNRTTL